MNDLLLDDFAQALLERVTEFEREKAALRKRHAALELKARQVRNTKRSANEAYQARQALKHPDLHSTANKAARKAASRRLEKAKKDLWIAMLEDWKCRIIASFAAEDLAAFDDQNDHSERRSNATEWPQNWTPGSTQQGRDEVSKSSADEHARAVDLHDPNREAPPTASTRPRHLIIGSRGPDEAPKAGYADHEGAHSTRTSSTRRLPEQEILPPLGRENDLFDDNQRDFF